MMTRNLTFILGLISVTHVFSQAPIHYHHNTFWGRVGVADQFSDKLKWEFYYQNRTQNDPSTEKSNIFRYHQTTNYTFALYYPLAKNLKLSFSPFVYFRSTGLLPRAADSGNRAVNEFRWMLQLEHTGMIGKVNVAHRYTSEYRYRDLYAANDYVSNFRFRYRGKFEHTVGGQQHPVTLMLYDEIFFEFGGSVKGSPAIFNQNRLFGGFNYEIVDHVKLNLGYIYVAQERLSGKVFDHSNVLSAAITVEGLFTKRNKTKENISDAQPGD